MFVAIRNTLRLILEEVYEFEDKIMVIYLESGKNLSTISVILESPYHTYLAIVNVNQLSISIADGLHQHDSYHASIEDPNLFEKVFCAINNTILKNLTISIDYQKSQSYDSNELESIFNKIKTLDVKFDEILKKYL